jgi:hypothetical protein
MVPVPDSDFVLPTVDDVGALLRARTQDTADDELGTFNDETRPTGEEVEILIKQAGSVVLARTGSLNDPPLSCPTAPDVRANAAYLVSLLAAMLVELSYFPEQVRSDRSPYENYRELFNESITGLIDAAVECRGGEVIPDDAGEGFRPGPSYSFPVDGGGLIGWQTQW